MNQCGWVVNQAWASVKHNNDEHSCKKTHEHIGRVNKELHVQTINAVHSHYADQAFLGTMCELLVQRAHCAAVHGVQLAERGVDHSHLVSFV